MPESEPLCVVSPAGLKMDGSRIYLNVTGLAALRRGLDPFEAHPAAEVVFQVTVDGLPTTITLIHSTQADFESSCPIR